MRSNSRFLLRWFSLITFACLFFATGDGYTQGTSFSFTLDEPCKTSAGVYAADGSLVRTLWSKVRYYAAGTYSNVWDGLDDNSNAVPPGIYEIKLLQHNTEYVWDGAIGNTSAESSGPTVHMAFYPMQDMTIAGTNAFYVSGYNEGKYDFCNFLTTNPQQVKAKWGPAGQTATTQDPSWGWTVTDGNWVYFACPLTYAPKTLTNLAPGCILAFNVADDSTTNFSDGVIITNGSDVPYPGIYVGTKPGLSGLAVQQSGNLLAVSVAPDNRVYLLNKRSGATVTNIGVTSPGSLGFSPDGSLWVISGDSVICYTNLSNSPSVSLTIPNFSEPLAVAVNSTNPNLILVADGGTSQQVKAFNSLGASLWTYGMPGGYQSNGVAVTTNKFWFNNGENDWTFLCFAPDGSFWVGDGANDRCLHFSATLNYIEQIMYQPHAYVACADQNNPSRVFDQFLEFNVDYTKPLPQAWTLVNNWGANVNPCNISWNAGIREVTTLTNGRTYALVDNNCVNVLPKQELCELGTNQLRLTGIFPFGTNESSWITMDPDGAVRFTTAGAAIWYQSTLSGFDTNGNPEWNPSNMIASASNGGTDPVPRSGSGMNNISSISTNNILISFDQSLNDGWHLGGIQVGTTNWLWKASPAGDLNGYGTYEIDNGVEYGGNTAQALDRQVVYGYNGEFFRSQGQAAQNMHFYDDGLFVGQFGEATLGHSAYEGALPGYAGNGFSPSFTKTTIGDYYLWVNDESAHGLQRWHFANARNIREQIGSGTLGSTIVLTNQAYGFPSGVTAQTGNGTAELSWLPVQGASSYNIRYSFINGGPYNRLAGNTTNLDFVASGLTNGQTCYFAVTAIQSGMEGMPSEQVAITPFDTSQTVLCTGSMTEGGQQTPVVDINSNAPESGLPSYIGAEHFTGVLNLRELDDYGYGNLQNEIVGTKGYVIYDWGGYGLNLTNVTSNFTITPGSGWSDMNYLERQYRVNNVLGDNYGLIANPVGSINIGVGDTNYHYLTVISPAKFNNPRQFTISIISTNNTSAAFTINENPGYSHVFQFMFRGDVTLRADATGGSDAIVQALFLDDAQVAFPSGSISPPQSTNSSITMVTASQNPALAGSLVTFIAVVSGSGGTPTGTVGFFDGTNSLGTETLNSSGTAVLSTAALSVNGSPHSITADYTGNATFVGSSSSVFTETITNSSTGEPPPPIFSDITNGLVVDYPLATNGDDIWSGKDLTLMGSPVFDAGAVNWNGALPTFGYSTPEEWPQSGLTVSGWINMADPTANYIVATCYENVNGTVNQSYFQFFTKTNGLTARVVQNRDVNYIGRTTLAMLTAGWHFVAFSWAGGLTSSSIMIYLDGTEIDNADESEGTFTGPYAGSDIPLCVGAQVSPGGSFAGQFYGSQMDVRMYGRALSASEIATLFANGANPAWPTISPALLPPTQLRIIAP
jgi:hypothetical protein